MSFVRFEGCDLKCRWCDTPESFRVHSTFRVEKLAFSGIWEEEPNSVSGEGIEKWLSHFSDPMVSLTGGEPLQQVDFLEEWLPEASQKFTFLLETNGVLPEALGRVLPWIHTVSMDIKLPSSARTGAFWGEHEAFLRLALNSPECYVKVVVTQGTEAADLECALELIRSVSQKLPVILQPASPTRAFGGAPSALSLSAFLDQGSSLLKGIRVIPQVHKILGIS